ncbi:hypothetical protein [Pontiella agarivorans]|uniref:Lipoprotein n=1 Tax=Pontiella agarivorans TaxID=3038953 RepID=A0ABU5MXA5_9BACT|nr:hypothetical protein [Pontiella agarivorans]MDZ8118814.1 hypothetical protein [Pontiella agarivorans]
MMKKILISTFIGLSLAGCKTTSITSTEKTSEPKTEKATKIAEPKPELADFTFAKWEGRNIYNFFYEVFEEGTPVSSFTNEVFSTASYKGVSWEIIQASRGMNVVGVHVKSEWPYGSVGYAGDKRDMQPRVPFPIDQATFVINRWSDVSYLNGQKFKQYVIFTGYEEGFLQFSGNETNEVKKLCFLTISGLKDAINYFESAEQ